MTHQQITVFGIAFIFIMTALGSALVFCFKREIPPRLNAILLGGASGVMIAASVWSLLLPAIEQAGEGWGNLAFLPIGLGFLLGGVFLLLLDKWSPTLTTRRRGDKKGKGGALSGAAKLFLAVTLHNIPEGIAVGFAFGAAHALGTTSAYLSALGLAIGMGIQNFPEGAAVALPIKGETGSKTKGFLFGAFSGVVEPFFAIIGFFLATYLRPLQPWLLSFSAGAMLFVVAEELIPKANADGEALSTAWGVMVGFTLMMILDVSL